jgi:uncharacterized protein
MNSLYITSVERYSGKTAACLAIAAHLKADGHRVGYLKPVSLQPYRLGDRVVDEDAAFVIQTLGLDAEAHELSPVVITPDSLRSRLTALGEQDDLMNEVRSAYQRVLEKNDVVILEGGASLREGYVVGLPTVLVAETLSSCVLVVVKYRDEVRLLDDCLAARTRLGNAFCGVLINRLQKDSEYFVKELAVPHLEAHDIPVFGVLPDVRGLAALGVSELIQALDAEVLTRRTNLQALAESVMVGAMSAEAALSRFRKQSNKAVITGGDRTDIQLAALETSTACLILTGNLRPSPLVIRQAEEFGVTVMLVRSNTMETIEAIERIYGKTRLGQASKLKQFQALMDEHFNYARLKEAMRQQPG